MHVTTPMVLALVDVLERMGVPRSLLLKGRVDPDRLQNPDERFSGEEYDRLLCAAIDLTGRETLGLHAAVASSAASFDVVAHVVEHAATLREAIQMSIQFGPILAEGCFLRLEEAVDVAALRYEFAPLSPRASRFHIDFVLASLQRLIVSAAAGRDCRIRASMSYPAPADPSEYKRHFGTVLFGQSANRLEFRRDLLDAPTIYGNAALHAVLLPEAQRKLERVTGGSGVVDRLRTYLLSRHPSRMPGMDEAARAIGTSPRSLRRRLAEEGLTYREMVNGLLEESALNLLKAPRGSIQEVAQAMGFSDTSAFHRAFKRWTGVTPSAFRRSSLTRPHGIAARGESHG